ncbi:MAG TPA: DUF3422 domain-containing protein [Burkholderiaceae bacterium]|nr:DUF3422 domain-containing protein [Burkholderiaceae bacterium]
MSNLSQRLQTVQQVVQHPLRVALHNEIHARPPEALTAPIAITHIVMLCSEDERNLSRAHVAKLLRDHHLPQLDDHATHIRMDIAGFRLRWELHTEFVNYTFMRNIDLAEFPEGTQPLLPTALEVVPQAWLAGLPGQNVSSAHLWVMKQHEFQIKPQSNAWCKAILNEDTLLGSNVAGGFAQVFTDFAIHADGYSRVLVFAGDMTQRRIGRLVLRLIEIETYRMLALLGLPVARQSAHALMQQETELVDLAQAIRSSGSMGNPDQLDDAKLLDRLTLLAGQVESQYAATHSRFSASTAYFKLVDDRIKEIDESRLPGLQTIREFMDRRLTPARSTCEWAAKRQDALSTRVSRISNLLSTRVEIEQQQSSQALLSTMNSRQDLQLKLQSTVEGLSVAAITYYIVGLIGYVAKGAQKMNWPLSSEMTSAIAVPFVALLVWWSLKRVHRKIKGHR